MAVTVSNQGRDGNLCTVTFSVTGNGSATTSFDVVGHIKQFALNLVSGVGSDPFDIELSDTRHRYLMFSENNKTADELQNSIRNGAGGYCQGPLKLFVENHAGSLGFEVIVYYERM
jgi:hypothetical protein